MINIYYAIFIALMTLWTAFTAAYTMLWVARQISIETDAVTVVPDKASDFYLFNWQTWSGYELLNYILRHYWSYFFPTAVSFGCVVALLVLAL